MLVLLKAESSGLRSAIAVEETLNAQKELADILSRSGTPFKMLNEQVTDIASSVEPEAGPVETIPPFEEPELGELKAMLEGSASSLDHKQVEHYWEQTSGSEPFLPDNPDVITYDQARKLGLTPEEENHS